MKEFKMNEKVIKLPELWTEVTWEKFLGFTKIIQNHEKVEEAKKEEGSDDENEWKEAIRALELNTKILSFWTGLSQEEISHWDMLEAETLMKCLDFVNDKYIDLGEFTINEEKFFLPKNLMRETTFGRYIEAEQLEIQSELIKKGKIEIMPRQIAILAKKEGEGDNLDDDVIDKRAKLFEKLDMATIWDVAFFLTKLEQGLMISSLTSQVVAEMQQVQEPQKEQ
jgi:hypothetical protein